VVVVRRDPRKTTVEELLSDLLSRIRRVETRTRATVGSGANTYVLEVNGAGQLTARHAGTGTVTVIASP
jgi:hypothetical protein